jgi:hypothetical protein
MTLGNDNYLFLHVLHTEPSILCDVTVIDRPTSHKTNKQTNSVALSPRANYTD